MDLAEVAVYSPRVANQEPAATFAMPVSALRFEPRLDVQGRNLAEAQADIAIRGGTFENTGIRLGALALYDPQTGHYLSEIPVAPAMLGAPDVHTGADNTALGWNATAGTIAYGWRPVTTAGRITVGGGEFGTYLTDLYQGFRSDRTFWGQTLAADAAVANSGSNGSVPQGESRFNRLNARFQLASKTAQTDLVYGYQEKFFGWPNLYTPFGSNETENLQTVLVALNHRVELGDGQFFEAGAYWRRNKDDYAFNRFAPLGPVHPFQHTTRVSGASADGRTRWANLTVNYQAGVVRDDLQSTSLVSGRFHSRTFTTAGIFPERRWTLAGGREFMAMAGAKYDDTNRDGSAISPAATLSLENKSTPVAWSRVYFSYAKTTQEPTYTALNSSASSGLFRGNPNLGRSVSHNVELGANGTWMGWESSVAVFVRRDERLVDWTFARGVTARTANAVDLETAGVELFARRTMGRFDLVLGYTYLSKNPDYGSATIDASFYALNYPRNRLTAAIVARLGAGWEIRVDNDARFQAANSLRVSGGDDALLSTVGVYFRPASVRGLTWAVQVENAWDSKFQAVPAVPAARRQLGTSVTYAW